MKIAVNYENGNVFQHFGQTKMFKVFEVEDKQIQSSTLLEADPQGHAALASQLINEKVDVVICGSLGMRMLNLLQGANIQVCANVSGDVDQAVKEYLEGTLNYNTEAHACSCTH